MRIDDDGENIRIIDHALLHIRPALAAVGGFPGQMPGAGVNGLRIVGVDGHRLKVLDLRVMRRADLVRAFAPVEAAIDTINGARHDAFRVARGRSYSPERLASQSG